MTGTRAFLALGVLLALAGCQTQGQQLANEQQLAMDTAVRRGRFELSCPSATATLLSSNMLQPIAWGGQERAEYTVGIAGCNQKMTYVVICPQESEACFAGRGDR
jgi:hypothetical protein